MLNKVSFGKSWTLNFNDPEVDNAKLRTLHTIEIDKQLRKLENPELNFVVDQDKTGKTRILTGPEADTFYSTPREKRDSVFERLMEKNHTRIDVNKYSVLSVTPDGDDVSIKDTNAK